MNYANSGNCDIMYIPRCVGKVIICGIKACSRYNVLSAAVPGPKAPKAGRSPARDRQTEGSTTRRFAINTCKVPHICRTTFHTKGESSNTYGVLYTMTRGASPRFGGGDLMVQPLENIVADADIKGIKDEFFVIVPDDEHEGCFLPYLYVQLKDGYTLDDVRDKINACLPERYMRPVEIFTVPERPFFHFKTNRIGLSKEIIAKRNQQKEKAKRNSFADGCIA